MKTVKELKQEIDKIMVPGYTYQTNLSWAERLVSINYGLGIGVKLVQIEDKMVYEFIVDTQFVSSKEITYDEIVLCKNIIDILEKNRSFVLSRLKKYNVQEYQQEKTEFEKRQKALMKFFESLVQGDKLFGEEKDYEY